MATVIGVFNSREQAERAVRNMRDKGFTENEISIIAKKGQSGEGRGRGDQESAQELGREGFGGAGAGEDMTEGTAWGGTLGGIAGLLAGVGALAIPGVGPIVAAGPLAATLSGALAGGVAGGLIDLGIPEERGRFFEEEVKRGRILAVVEAAGERTGEAANILRANGASDVETHQGAKGETRGKGGEGGERTGRR